MKVIFILVASVLLPIFVNAQDVIPPNAKQTDCLEGVFYAVRPQDSIQICSRGKPCTLTGLLFSQYKNYPCAMELARGDTIIMYYYSQKGNSITLIPSYSGNNDEFPKKYKLSDDKATLANFDKPEIAYKLKKK